MSPTPVPGENKSITVIISVIIAKGSQHLAGVEGGAGARGARGATNADRFVLDEGGGGPRDVVTFVLSGARLKVENGPSEERTDDGLLEWGDDAGMDGGIHEAILDGVEAFGEDIIVSREAHIARHRGWRLIRLLGW